MRAASPRTALALLIAAVAAVKMFLQATIPGFLQGDDVETLESAFRAAFGLQYDDWEIRSHLLPELIVAPLLRLVAALADVGIDGLLLAASIPFIVAGAVTTLLVFRLARAWGLAESDAVAAAVLYAVHAIPVVYGIGGFPRVLVTPLILCAALLATRERTVHLAAAGLLVGLAGAARYSEWMFLLPLLAMVASGVVRASRPPPGGGDLRGPEAGETPAPHGARRVAARLTFAVTGFVAGACVVGLYDLVSGEGAFSSLVEFARFTLAGGSSSAEAAQPFWWYLARLHQWLPLTALPLLVWGWRRWRRNALFWVALPLLVFSVVHHKELRYLQNVIPFVAIAIAAGVSRANPVGPLPGSGDGDGDLDSGGRAARDTPATFWHASGERRIPAIVQPSSGERRIPAIVQPSSGVRRIPAIVQPSSGERRIPAIVRPSSGVLPFALLALSILWGAWGVNRLDKRSSSAVAAARAIAESGPRAVAVEQAWAYGDHLYFPETAVTDLPVDPSPADLGRAGEAEFVSLYASHATPRRRAELGQLGFAPWRDFSEGGRPVVVLRRALPPG